MSTTERKKCGLAERVGVEPTRAVKPYPISSRALSTTQPPLQKHSISNQCECQLNELVSTPNFLLTLTLMTHTHFAPSEGLEPPTPTLGRSRSIHLSYEGGSATHASAHFIIL